MFELLIALNPLPVVLLYALPMTVSRRSRLSNLLQALLYRIALSSCRWSIRKPQSSESELQCLSSRLLALNSAKSFASLYAALLFLEIRHHPSAVGMLAQILFRLLEILPVLNVVGALPGPHSTVGAPVNTTSGLIIGHALRELLPGL